MRVALSILRRGLFRRDAACVVGGSLGIISLFFNWYYSPDPNVYIVPQPGDYSYFWFHWDPYRSGIELLSVPPGGLTTGVLIFAIGSIIALVARIGFIPQLAGLLMFLLDFNHVRAVVSNGYELQLLTGFSSGYLIALLAVLVSSFGSATPMWRRTKHRYAPATFRILALSPNASRIQD